MILKMDVEGAEWEAINATESGLFENYDQIVMELHSMLDITKYDMILPALEKLSRTHQAVWVHGNNWNNFNHCGEFVTPNSLEIVFARKRSYHFVDSSQEMHFPLPEDMPNNPSRPELYLGTWNPL